MTEEQTARQRIEQAVTKVGRAYEELVRIVEKNGSGLSREDLAKVFNFLAQVHAGSRNKAELSLSTAIAANGSFSLDKDYGLTPAAEPMVPQEVTVSNSVVVSADGRPEGRLVGMRPAKRDPLDHPDASDFLEE